MQYLYPLSVFYFVLGISAAVRLIGDVSDIYQNFLKLVMAGCFLRFVTLVLWFPLEDAINNALMTPTFLIIFFDMGGFMFLAAYLLAPSCLMFGDQGGGDFQDEIFEWFTIVGALQGIAWFFSLWQPARVVLRWLSLLLLMMIYGITVARVFRSSYSTRNDNTPHPVYGTGRTTRGMITIVCLFGLVINTFLLLLCIINIDRDPLRRRDGMLCFVFFLGEMAPVFGAFNVPWLIVKLRDMKRRDLTLPSTSREDAGNDHQGEPHIRPLEASSPSFEVPQDRSGLSPSRRVQPQTTGNPESQSEASRRYLSRSLENWTPQSQSGRVQDNRPQDGDPVLRPPAANQGSSSRKPVPYYDNDIPLVDASSVPGLRFKKEGVKCVVCLDRCQTSGYLHDLRVCTCVCRECARQFYRSGSSCPICRDRIDAIVDNI